MNNITKNKQAKNNCCSTEKWGYQMIAQFNIHVHIKHDTFNNSTIIQLVFEIPVNQHGCKSKLISPIICYSTNTWAGMQQNSNFSETEK